MPSCFSVEIYEQVISFIEPDAMEPRDVQLRVETVPNSNGQVLGGRYLVGELRDLLVEMAMVQSFDDLAVHSFLQLFQVNNKSGSRIYLTLHRDFKHVIVPVPVGIVALAEDASVLLRREFRVVIVVRGRKLRPAHQINHIVTAI